MSYDQRELILGNAIHEELQRRKVAKQFIMRDLAERNIIPHVMRGGQEYKSCARCGSLKLLEEYTKRAASRDRLNPHCRDCQRTIDQKRAERAAQEKAEMKV